MLDFKPITLNIKEQYESLSFKKDKSCLHTFATMFIWGNIQYVKIDNCFAFHGRYGKKNVYPFPIGEGDYIKIINLLSEDAKERNIPLHFSGLTQEDVIFLENNFPEKFNFSSKRDSQDYIYKIDDLASLSGKKYHSKKNHLNKFNKTFPEFKIEVINKTNAIKALTFAEEWYNNRNDEDIIYEKNALKKAFDNYDELGFEGIMLSSDNKILAITLASQTTENTFDVHFEKALKDADGAYTAINYYFANYIKEKYPRIEFLNREEDMGIEGLRKAKLSYHPYKMAERISATEIK